MRSKTKALVTAALLSGLAAGFPAEAAVITRTFALQATGFSAVAGDFSNPAPFTSVNGQFTLTFDTTGNSAGVLGTSLGLPAPYGVGLNYTYQSGIDRLNISQTPSSNINDGPFTPGGVYFSVQGTSTATPSLRNIVNGFFLVTNTTATTQYNTGNALISIVPAATPAVPEPGTWALMLMGFGGIGFAMRRRKRNVTTTVAYA